MEMDKNISAIHAIKNIISCIIYICSSCHPLDRGREHFSDLNKNHSNHFLQANFNKCGKIVLFLK